MAHNNHTKSLRNQDLDNFCREDYLAMCQGFQSSFDVPDVKTFKLEDGRKINVIDESEIAVGSKCRFGEMLIKNCPHKTIVYVQPRFGFAGISLTWLCKRYKKKLVLFMPSSKKVSEHQAWCIANGCEPHFYRIAAMPNLNKIAKEWADQNNAFFVPLGLRHPQVTAAVVNTCESLRSAGHNPGAIWCATSTGVLNRGLQIGFPGCQLHGVAVARNIKEGEKGTSTLFSYHKAFPQSVASKVFSPFDSCDNYDLKAWDICSQYADDGDYFWNVAGNLRLKRDFVDSVASKVDSYRDWGEIKDPQHSLFL